MIFTGKFSETADAWKIEKMQLQIWFCHFVISKTVLKKIIWEDDLKIFRFKDELTIFSMKFKVSLGNPTNVRKKVKSNWKNYEL